MNKITFEEFYDKFKIKRNSIQHISPYNNTMYDFGDEELDFLEDQERDHVWSLIDKNKDLIIVSGLRLKDSIGYFVSAKPWPCKLQYVLK